MSLSNGWIQELPRVFLDPRRPLVAAATPEMREEGIIPYLPELPIPPEAMINYNQTVANVKAIYVAPSSLESTGLVFAYGLGIILFLKSNFSNCNNLDDFDGRCVFYSRNPIAHL